MKLQTSDSPVIYSHEMTGDKYAFKFNAKMVKILSDGIYGDKITAVIRELSINACESHALIRKQEPVLVHLPNFLEPYFSVEDFGVGLSEEEVYKVWCVYGESTKEQSNEFTGCLGLGSKTPFCYNTRTCTVQARKGGKEISFLSLLGEDGLPVIKKLTEKECTTDGLKITIPVNKNDISTFISKARDVYKYFDIIPKITGVNQTFGKKEYTLKQNNWGMNKDYPHQFSLVMGQIRYPINPTYCSIPHNAQVDIFVNIGDVDIEASREGLSYDDKTIAFCEKIVSEVGEDINKVILDGLHKTKNRFEAIKYLSAHPSKDFVRFPVKYKGGDIQGLNIELNKEYYLYDYDLNKTKTKSLDFRYTNYKNYDYFFAEDDVESYKFKRLQQVMKEGQRAIIVDSTDRQLFINEVGIDEDDLVKLSTVDYKAKRGIGVRQKTDKVNQLNQWFSGVTSAWKSVTLDKIDLNQKAYYTTIHHYQFFFNGRFRPPDYLRNISTLLGVVLIYGIKKDFKNIPSAWTPLEEAIFDEADKVGLQEASFYTLKYKNSTNFILLSKLFKHKDIIKSPLVLDLLEQYDFVQKKILLWKSEYGTIGGILPAQTFPEINFGEIDDKFPLVSSIPQYNLGDVEIVELIEYINNKGI